MRKIIIVLQIIFMAITFTHAQIPSASPANGVVPAIANVSGGSYDNAASYYRFEWSFGELLLVQAFAPSDSSVIVTQGLLQPFTEIIRKSTSSTTLFENGDYKLFPNPTGGQFEIDFFIRTSGQMSLRLIDATGRLLEKRKFHYDNCCRINLFDLTKYSEGIYFVIADLEPDTQAPGDNPEKTRHSGLKIIKLNKQ